RGFTTYSAAFAEAVADKQKLGLSEEAGLEGALRKSVHEIESALKKFDEPRLAVIMLMMRRHEKDFMLRRAAKYGKEMQDRATEFSASLAKAENVPDGAKADLKAKLDAYQRDFFEWMATADKLAATLKRTSEAYARIEPVIAEVDKTIAQSLSAAEQNDD